MDPEITVPVVLVTDTNPPGAMTYRLRGGPACIVDIDAAGDPRLLQEIILHESTHTLDAASRGSRSAFATLRTLLEKRGLSPRDRAYHDIPHTLMFVQAEETMRRIYDRDHTAYGEVSGVYERSGRIAEVQRSIWRRVLDGEIGRAAGLEAIIEQIDPRPSGGRSD